MVYRAKERSGGLCDGCAYRAACPVTDNQLKIWVRAGMACLSRRPEKISVDSNKNYQI